MPNWVTNNLNIAEKDLETFKKLALDENGMVDFNILIPRPKDLDITAGGYEWYKDKYGFNKEKELQQNTILKPILDELYNEELTQDEFVKLVYGKVSSKITKIYNCSNKKDKENVLRGYYNLRKHGYANWYEWSCDKWGTKWNACETYGSGSSFTFDTAWCSPRGWLLELSKHVDFKGSFADEDLGVNLGIFYKEDNTLWLDRLEDFNQDELYYIANLIRGNDIEWYEEWLGYNEDLEPISDDRQKEIDEILEEYI